MRSNHQLAGFARNLRVEQTDAEGLLWQRLRNRQLAGCKFRRQRVIGQYVADFVCLEAKLIVEIDGSQHMERAGYDQARSEFFGSRGYRVLRYWNHQVLQQPEVVLEDILRHLAPHPNPLPANGARK